MNTEKCNEPGVLGAIEEDAPEWIVEYGSFETGRDIGEVHVKAHSDLEAYWNADFLLGGNPRLGIGKPRRVS